MRHISAIPITLGATAKRIEKSHLPAHGHYAPTGVRRRRIVTAALAFGDLATAIGSAQLATLFVDSVHASPLGGGAVPILAPLLLVVHWCLGLYAGRGPSPIERLRLRALGILAFTTSAYILAAPTVALGRLVLFLACTSLMMLVLGYYIEAIVRRILVRHGLWGAPTALISCNEASQDLAKMLIARPELGLRPVCFVDDLVDRGEGMGRLPIPILGSLTEAAWLAANVEVAILVAPSQSTSIDVTHIACLPFANVVLAQDARDMQSLWLHPRTLGGSLGLEIRRDLHLPRNLWLKRLIDLMIAVPVGLASLPLIATLAAAIKIVDPGPAVYAQSRVGRNGQPLRVFKLRTMYTDAEQRLKDHLSSDPLARTEWERYFKLSNDPRILPLFGKVLRRASLDELPQLWNVIRGEMSIVGPRPFPSYHMERFDQNFQRLRTSVAQGLTGLWQVSSRSNGDLEVQKAQDLFYIRNWSIWLDLYIILETLPALLSARGAK
jgi:Undecaprenyl-phosphate galactose phosphotransferase WbaP